MAIWTSCSGGETPMKREASKEAKQQARQAAEKLIWWAEKRSQSPMDTENWSEWRYLDEEWRRALERVAAEARD